MKDTTNIPICKWPIKRPNEKRELHIIKQIHPTREEFLMKLAEALQERSDLTRKVSMLSERLGVYILVQEGDEPAENPADLLRELDAALDRIEELVAAINKTNSETLVDGRTITEALARKDRLAMEIAILRKLASKASAPQARQTRSEVRYVRTIDVAQMQGEADKLAKELRLLDNALQKANWETDLM